jgi:hypothetical protein
MGVGTRHGGRQAVAWRRERSSDMDAIIAIDVPFSQLVWPLEIQLCQDFRSAAFLSLLISPAGVRTAGNLIKWKI